MKSMFHANYTSVGLGTRWLSSTGEKMHVRIPLKTLPPLRMVMWFLKRENGFSTALVGFDGQYVLVDDAHRDAEEILGMLEKQHKFIGWIGLALSVECGGDMCIVETSRAKYALTRDETRKLISEIARKLSKP